MPQMLKPVNRQAWTVLAAATAINLTMGVNYSWSIISKVLVTDWHWTNLEASLPFSAYSTVYAFSAFFSGRAQDRFGPRVVASLGGVILGAGMIACSFSTTPLVMTVCYGVVVSIGNSMCYATTLPPVVKWFPPHRAGLVTGMVVSALGLAAVYMAPMASWLLARYGIANTFLFLGLGIVAAILGFAQLLRNPPATRGDEAGGEAAGAPPADFDWHEMIKTRLFLKLWLMLFFASSAGLMIFGHAATIAKKQANWENGFFLVVLLALFNTGGRLAGGILSDKFGRLTVMKAVFLLQAANLACFSSYTGLFLMAMGVMTAGLCYGACFTLFPLATADFFGVRNLGVNYGLLLTSWGSAGILGPIVAGWAIDTAGDYFLAYNISAVLLVAALAVAFSVKPPAVGPRKAA